MSLGYDIAQALPGLRAEAESRMSESVTVGRFEWVRPPGSLENVFTLVEAFYEGVARVKFSSASGLMKSPAGQQVAEAAVVVSVPTGSPLLPTGAVVRVESSNTDPALVGRLFRVDGPARAGQTTAHRYPVVEES